MNPVSSGTVGALIREMRPEQWTKNLVLFAGVIFAEHLFHVKLLLETLAAFVLFCLLSSTIYIINDIKDVEQDRTHPVKSKRPIAAEELSISFAKMAAWLIGGGSLLAAFILNVNFGYVATVYFILFFAYSLYFKHIVILDVLTLALGFVLRAIAGAVVIRVEVSPWLLLCTILLALFIALSKRRHELILLADNAHSHRKILREYSPHLLDQMIGVVTASTLMAYALYTMAPETKEKFGTSYMILTIPFVIYGIFRYLYLVHHKEQGGSPTSILINDKPILLNVLLWILVSVLIIYIK
jgi:4-hydroxybenzoate polyprenyltransferase